MRLSTRSTGKLTPRRRTLCGLLAALLLCALAAPAARAVEFKKGKLWGSWDTTVGYGVQFRLEDRDEAIIGTANGGTAYSVNGDDGDLNYNTGLSSNAFKLNTEIELNYKHFGAFFRGFAFYDIENEDQDRARTPLSDGALRRVGSRAEIRDAFVWYKFSIKDKPGQVRFGRQVLNWGESTFIQGGINTINPVDVSALRVPGAEIRDALLPVGMLWASFSLSRDVTLEGFYQFDWEPVKIDPPGSYFATNDFVGDGGRYVFLGFGDSSDLATYPGTERPFLAVPRDPSVLPDEGNQYGLALRWLLPRLADTELGFYYIRYHSRLPTVNGRTGTVAGAISASGFGTAGGTALVTLGMTGDRTAAISAGVNAGVGAGLSPVDATIVSTAAVDTQLGGGSGASVVSAFASDAYAQTAGYFVAYPEDIDLYGVSFNTQLGTSGWALQGELSHRNDVPLQADDVELLFAALTPINPAFGLGSPGASQLATYRDADYSTAFETPILGTERLDLDQIQATASKVFGPTLGADSAVFVFEAAVTLADLPSKNELRFDGPGTYTSGNPYHEAANPGAAHPGKAAENAKHFADSTSWGYRMAGRLEYNNAIGAFNLLPRFSWQQDVNGVSPGPGGSFLEGLTALTLGVAATYQATWEIDLSYTNYSGASRYNLITDRDFVAANAKYSF